MKRLVIAVCLLSLLLVSCGGGINCVPNGKKSLSECNGQCLEDLCRENGLSFPDFCVCTDGKTGKQVKTVN